MFSSLPPYTDLYYHDPTTLGNPNLQPEAAWSTGRCALRDKGGRYKAEVTVFERREKNDIDYIRSSFSRSWHAANIQSLSFTGVKQRFQVRLPHRQDVGLAT